MARYGEQVVPVDMQGIYVAACLDVLRKVDVHCHNAGVARLAQFGILHHVFGAIAAGQESSLEQAALYHDIGKNQISGTIYFKEVLEFDERNQFNQHPKHSTEILRAKEVPVSSLTRTAIEHHHPYGSKEPLLPEDTWIVRALVLCDVLRAGTEKRWYRDYKIIPQDQVREVITSEGKKFTPPLNFDTDWISVLTNEAYRQYAHGGSAVSTAVGKLASKLVKFC